LKIRKSIEVRQDRASLSEYKLSDPDEVIVKLADFGFSTVLEKDELANT
jgi:hypothetical protein